MPLRRSTSAVPPVEMISKPMSARCLTGMTIERLSRLATETKILPSVGRALFAAAWLLAKAVSKCLSMPMTSPVERISGPSRESTTLPSGGAEAAEGQHRLLDRDGRVQRQVEPSPVSGDIL